MSTHSFDTVDAEKYGVVPAILLYNIRFWVDKNAASRRHFYDGHYWAYNSVQAFSELFPYLTKDQIRRALERLESLGAIKTGCYNKSAYDRTKWFTCRSDLANLPNENGENAEPIPDVITDVITDTHSTSAAPRRDALRCPHQKIVDAYNDALPELPQVKLLTPAREKAIKSRWVEVLKAGKYADEANGVQWWAGFFAYVAKSDFLTGRTGTFTASFDWLMKPANFAKVIEGNYRNKAAA